MFILFGKGAVNFASFLLLLLFVHLTKRHESCVVLDFTQSGRWRVHWNFPAWTKRCGVHLGRYPMCSVCALHVKCGYDIPKFTRVGPIAALPVTSTGWAHKPARAHSLVPHEAPNLLTLHPLSHFRLWGKILTHFYYHQMKFHVDKKKLKFHIIQVYFLLVELA